MSTDFTPQFELSDEGGRTMLVVSGDWIVSEIGKLDAALRALAGKHNPTILDVSELGKIDTAGAYVLERTFHGAEDYIVQGEHDTAEELLGRIREASLPVEHCRAVDR